MKKTLLFLTLILLLLLTGCAAGEEPIQPGAPTAPDLVVSGKLILQANPDDTTGLVWDGVPGADGYRVELFGSDEQLLSSADTDTNACTVASFTGYATIRITCFVTEQDVPLLCRRSFSLTDTFCVPKVSQPQVWVNPITATVALNFTSPEGCFSRLYRADQEPELLQTLSTGYAELPLEKGGQYYLDACYDGGTYLYYGLPTEAFGPEAGALPEDGSSMSLSVQELSGNHISLSWEQGQDLTFRLQLAQDGTWQTLYGGTGGTFTTSRLTPHRQYRFRLVVLWDGQQLLTTEEVTVTPQTNVVYATAWPIQTLNVYSDTAQSKTIGTLEPVTPVCVLEQSGKWFKIRYKDTCGYIISDLCMVNLPEYLGDLCRYDIVNSYASLYQIHSYAIPGITGEICAGYENVMLSDGSFLVPYLYPAARRLEKAAKNAISQGYILKIFDAYRPRETTIDLYDRAEKLLYTPLPDGSGTYISLMTRDGTYSLGSFLAPGGSRHNMGIALDLTMVSLSTGQALQAQSTMHDLSWYSILDRNTADTKLLSQIMKGTGFSGLFSEWWHFSDATILDDYQLPYCYGSVSAQCWIYDGSGWRYRTSHGDFHTAGTFSIDGVSYTFDSQGYVTE